MTLSRLEGFVKPKSWLEQYRTPGNVAAELLWMAMPDLRGKVVADFGAGTGVLSIGACLVGASKVYAVEIDPEAVEVLKRNASRLEVTDSMTIVTGDVVKFSERVDTVIMNPPFGSQRPHADRPFLKKAFEVGKTVYSIHLARPDVRGFVERFSALHGFEVASRKTLKFEIPYTFHFHRRRLERIDVDMYRFQRRV